MNACESKFCGKNKTKKEKEKKKKRRKNTDLLVTVNDDGNKHVEDNKKDDKHVGSIVHWCQGRVEIAQILVACKITNGCSKKC